jgi:hypothetical protein
MAAISIGDAIGEGFGLIRRRPVSVLTWGAARTVFSFSVVALMAPIFMTMFTGALSAAKTGGAPPTAELASIMQLQGLNSLLSIGGAFLGTILYCAVTRSVLFPEQSRFAYMRVGAAELFLFLLTFGLSIVLVIALVIAFIPVGIVVAIAAASHAPALGVLVGFAVGIAALVFLLWAVCRLAMVGPMTVQDGKFHLFDAWTMTRGHAGTLFLIGLCLFVILFVIGAVIGVVVIALGFGLVGQAVGGFQNLPSFFRQPPATIMASLVPFIVVVGLIQIPITGCTLAIIGAPWARAYRDLAPPDVAATFA